jgi:4-hydroxy-tetrahydrodipicolinate reductase
MNKMKIIISGYGKMGKEVESILLEKGYEDISKIDSAEELRSIETSEGICIDFTTPEAFRNNYKTIADKFSGAVVGTTGWNDIENEVVKYFRDKGKGLIWASNFSIGVNIFFDALELISRESAQSGYDAYILEMHHKEKKDAPSGTAKTAQRIAEKEFGKEINPVSIRSGNIKGIHEAGFESGADKIILRHEAYSREGFAKGAVQAAEWLSEEMTVMNFRELLRKKLKK